MDHRPPPRSPRPHFSHHHPRHRINLSLGSPRARPQRHAPRLPPPKVTKYFFRTRIVSALQSCAKQSSKYFLAKAPSRIFRTFIMDNVTSPAERANADHSRIGITTYVNSLSAADVITPGLPSWLPPSPASASPGLTPSPRCKYDALKPIPNSPPVKSTSIVSVASPI